MSHVKGHQWRRACCICGDAWALQAKGIADSAHQIADPIPCGNCRTDAVAQIELKLCELLVHTAHINTCPGVRKCPALLLSIWYCCKTLLQQNSVLWVHSLPFHGWKPASHSEWYLLLTCAVFKIRFLSSCCDYTAGWAYAEQYIAYSDCMLSTSMTMIVSWLVLPLRIRRICSASHL